MRRESWFKFSQIKHTVCLSYVISFIVDGTGTLQKLVFICLHLNVVPGVDVLWSLTINWSSGWLDKFRINHHASCEVFIFVDFFQDVLISDLLPDELVPNPGLDFWCFIILFFDQEWLFLLLRCDRWYTVSSFSDDCLVLFGYRNHLRLLDALLLFFWGCLILFFTKSP